MKKAKRLLTVALAALTIASTMVIGTASVSAASLKAPKISVSNEEKTIKITWKKVAGAKKYKVYRDKKLIKTTTKLKASDFAVYAGKNYTYSVKAVNGKKTSKASASVKATRVNYTIIRILENKANSVSIKWNKRKGANQYKLYRATTGAYKLIATTSKNSFNDKDVVSGKTYTYKIRSINTKTNSKSLYCTPKSIVFLSRVEDVKARENVDTKSISLSWTATKGAKSYDIYRLKAGDSSYVKVANVTETSYKDTDTVDNPTVYSYKIYAVSDSSKSVESAPRFAPFAPKTDGENRYRYYDTDNNLHVLLHLTVGEEYKEGKALADTLSLQDLYQAVSADESVATVEDGVITAVSKGSTVITITCTDTALELANQVECDGISRILTKTTYIEVEVA